MRVGAPADCAISITTFPVDAVDRLGRVGNFSSAPFGHWSADVQRMDPDFSGAFPGLQCILHQDTPGYCLTSANLSLQ